MKKKVQTRHVCILMPDELFEKIKEITDVQEISISEYLRNIIQEKLQESTKNV